MSTLKLLVEALLCLGAVTLIVPQGFVLLETLGALLPRPKLPRGPVGSAPRIAVLIPAHDEAAQIGATVRGLAEQLRLTATERAVPGVADKSAALSRESLTSTADRLIVIADNCTDDTAELARRAGATVIERQDAQRRGKGYAIAFALEHLDADPPDVVILVDADCRVSAEGLPLLARLAAALNRPIQGEYLIQSPPDPSPVAVVSGLAVMIRNRVRPRGLARFGLPCHLTGSGMAFPWRVLRDAPAMGAELVEDLVMGIQMALSGHAPLFCPEVRVSSELPDDKGAAMSQRRRWEHGQLHTLVKYFPRLIWWGVSRGRIGLIGLGLDLMVPPLALLVMLQLGILGLTLLAGFTGLTSWLPLGLASVGLGALTVAIGAAWMAFGRQIAPLRYMLFIPFYVLWKIPLYLSLAFRGKQKTWERTARRSESDPK